MHLCDDVIDNALARFEQVVSSPNCADLPSAPINKRIRINHCLQGPSVVNAIDAFKPSERATGKPFRMPISDVFKGQRGGICVGGKLEGGAVQVGTTVRVLPSNEVATIKSVEVDGAAQSIARAGDSADLTLAGEVWHAVHAETKTLTHVADMCI